MEPDIPDGAHVEFTVVFEPTISPGIYLIRYYEMGESVFTVKRLRRTIEGYWLAFATNPDCDWARLWPQGRLFEEDNRPEVLGRLLRIHGRP